MHEGQGRTRAIASKFGRHNRRRRAPTRGAPTRFRQPHEVFSNLMQLPCGGGAGRTPKHNFVRGGPRRGTENTLTPFDLLKVSGDVGRGLGRGVGGCAACAGGYVGGRWFVREMGAGREEGCVKSAAGGVAGQSHLNSDSTIALRRAPTRGAPTNCQSFSDESRILQEMPVEACVGLGASFAKQLGEAFGQRRPLIAKSKPGPSKLPPALGGR